MLNAKMSQCSGGALHGQSVPVLLLPLLLLFPRVSFPDCLSNLHSLNCIFGIVPDFVSSQQSEARKVRKVNLEMSALSIIFMCSF